MDAHTWSLEFGVWSWELEFGVCRHFSVFRFPKLTLKFVDLTLEFGVQLFQSYVHNFKFTYIISSGGHYSGQGHNSSQGYKKSIRY
jgi:hypothetical protein